MAHRALLSLAVTASLTVAPCALSWADASPRPSSASPSASPEVPARGVVPTPTTAQVTAPALRSPATPGQSPSRFIITRAVSGGSTTGDDALAAQAAAVGAKVSELRPLASGDDVVILDRLLDDKATTTFMESAASAAGVLRVEPDERMRPLELPTAQAIDATPALTGLTGAQAASRGKGVTVAVIDTGTAPGADPRAASGYDFISDPQVSRDGDGRDADPRDAGDWAAAGDPCSATPSSWHGTAMAGAINGAGRLAGVAPEAKVLSVRALGRCGGFSSDIIDALLWSAGQPVLGTPANTSPARVVLLPFSAPGTCSFSYQNAINQVAAKGVTVVAGVGSTPNQDSTPSSCANVLSVGASNGSTLARYSAPVPATGLLAPGGDAQRGFATATDTGASSPQAASIRASYGTALAAAHVAGAAALIAGAAPQMTSGHIDQLLHRSATRLNCEGCGAGIVDIGAALKQLETTPPGGTPTGQPGDRPTEPAATKAPTGSNVLLNGDFESGATGWRGDTGTIGAKHKQAAQGQFKAWLLGYGRTGAEQISQPVAIPAGKKNATLSFALQITSDETKPYAYDKMVIRVFDWNGRYLGTLATFSNVDKTSGYSVKTLDMSQFIGQKIQIQFGAVEDRSLPTSFLLDDVSLTVS